MMRFTRQLTRPTVADPAASTTLTLENPSFSQQPQQPTTLTLELRRKKKKVTWKDGTVDNEFLNKMSSKKCCIFHKEKPFDEDASDDEDDGCNHPFDDHRHGEARCS